LTNSIVNNLESQKNWRMKLMILIQFSIRSCFSKKRMMMLKMFQKIRRAKLVRMKVNIKNRMSKKTQ
jgi:hypothetical protein